MESHVLEKGGYDRLLLSVRCFLLNPYIKRKGQGLIRGGLSRLFLEYARLMSLDREGMTYNG